MKKKINVLAVAAMIIIAAMLMMLLPACSGESEPKIVMTNEHHEEYGVDIYFAIDNWTDDTYAYARWDGGENIDLERDELSGNIIINDVQGSKLEIFTNGEIITLGCGQCSLTSLDVSNCPNLTYLGCSGNNLTSLDVSDCPKLTRLYCTGNSLTSLDVSNNTALTMLDCSANALTMLDCSGCTALTELCCGFNALTTLDVSNNTALTMLDCSVNNLTSLDVSCNTALESLYCSGNALTTLDVSNCPNLTELYCDDNSPTVPNLQAELGEFFTGPDFEAEETFPSTPSGEHYGFSDDIWADYGCSVWCAIRDSKFSTGGSSFLPAQGDCSYGFENLIDGNRKTAWSEGVEGSGIGESFYIERTLWRSDDEQYDITYKQLCIVNGYARDEKSWRNNGRVKRLSLWLDGAHVADLLLEDTIKPQYFDLEGLGIVAASGQTITFAFEIEEVYPGEKYEDTCLTGIEFSFWTANH